MPRKAVGTTAAELPWLCPRSDSLLALAESPEQLPQRALSDPGLAVLLVRQGRGAEHFRFSGAELATAAPLEYAAAMLARPPCGCLPWTSQAFQHLWQHTRLAAEWAARLAERSRREVPDDARVAALLAPLGWLAVAAVDGLALGDVLHEPQHARQPRRIQQQLWGCDHAAVARRLAYRWSLPPWLTQLLGRLHLPYSPLRNGLDRPHLFAIVQLAWQQVERAVGTYGISPETPDPGLLDELGLSPDVAAELCHPCDVPSSVTVKQELPDDPYQQPLLGKLLQLVAQARRHHPWLLVSRLEAEQDRWQEMFEEYVRQEQERLFAAKMAALAQFTAGAAHEINNPLAIISATAQRLRRTEPDPQRQEALHVIIRHCDRIAELLRELMTFARPPRRQRQVVSVAELLDEVQGAVQPDTAGGPQAGTVPHPAVASGQSVESATEVTSVSTVASASVVASERSVASASAVASEQTVVPCPPAASHPTPATGTATAVSGRLDVVLPHEPLWIEADLQQVRQAVAAVVQNGLDATADGRVRLTVHAEPTCVAIIVEDEGPGLPPPVREHAFDPFFSGREAGRGRGLGLPTAWRLLRHNGGDLRYAPTPQTPGRFVITLPRVFPDEVPLRQSA